MKAMWNRRRTSASKRRGSDNNGRDRQSSVAFESDPRGGALAGLCGGKSHVPVADATGYCMAPCRADAEDSQGPPIIEGDVEPPANVGVEHGWLQ